MSVGDYALTTLANTKEYLQLSDTELERDGLTIYNTNGDATAATAEVTTTTLVLTVTGGANAGTDTLTFSDAANDTLGELVTVINALTPRTWTANRQAHSSSNSTDLVIVGATGCLGSANEITLDIVDNYLLEQLINQATDIIEKYCRRKFKSRTYYHERYQGFGGNIIYLKNYPVTAIEYIAKGLQNPMYITNTSSDAAHAYAKVTHANNSSLAYEKKPDELVLKVIGGTNEHVAQSYDLTDASYDTLAELESTINSYGYGWSATVPSSSNDNIKSIDIIPFTNRECLDNTVYLQIPDEPLDTYYCDEDSGEIYIPSNISGGQNAILTTYTAGYSTIPNTLEEVCHSLVSFLQSKSKKDLSVKSEKTGDYSYTLRDTDLTPDMKSELNLFAKKMA